MPGFVFFTNTLIADQAISEFLCFVTNKLRLSTWELFLKLSQCCFRAINCRWVRWHRLNLMCCLLIFLWVILYHGHEKHRDKVLRMLENHILMQNPGVESLHISRFHSFRTTAYNFLSQSIYETKKLSEKVVNLYFGWESQDV